jgi:ABC-type lipoprotein release transport system permease subunit
VVFGVDRGEPWLYAAVAGTLLVACVGAAMTPALRAARVDPHVALRAE